jgi:hypothetical protein
MPNMNSQNCSANTEKTVPAEYVPPMSLQRFCQIIGLSKASAWRYEKRGWLRTHLIANRRYVLAADVAEFNRRLASDKFAGSVPNPSAARSIKPKKERNAARSGAVLMPARDGSLLSPLGRSVSLLLRCVGFLGSSQFDRFVKKPANGRSPDHPIQSPIRAAKSASLKECMDS